MLTFKAYIFIMKLFTKIYKNKSLKGKEKVCSNILSCFDFSKDVIYFT